MGGLPPKRRPWTSHQTITPQRVGHAIAGSGMQLHACAHSMKKNAHMRAQCSSLDRVRLEHLT